GIAFRRTARGALWAAIGLSIFYMIAGTLVLPALWLDPVGPMLKIWPIIALNLVALAVVEDR
ncbi:MAG TPA: DoxX-like family protein, partial [Gammaproteobacteria bacterium]|nr:DoxX-like family protein [Gammaproteobacteria bacterium]